MEACIKSGEETGQSCGQYEHRNVGMAALSTVALNAVLSLVGNLRL